MDVFYHVNIEPKKDINNIYELIHKNGLLLLNVAAMPCLMRGHDTRVMGARRFLKTELEDLILETGLFIRSIYYWNSFMMPVILVSIIKEKLQLHHSTKDSSMHVPPKLMNLALLD